MKNGVVLELYKKHVAVLTPEGEFLKVRKDPQLCYIGEEIWFRESDVEIPGVINKLKKRCATPKFLFQGAALATGLLLFFTTGLDTYMSKALSEQSENLASAFDINGDDDNNQPLNDSSRLAANKEFSNKTEDASKSSISQVIGESPAVAFNGNEPQDLNSTSTSTSSGYEFNQGNSAILTSSDSDSIFIDEPITDNYLNSGYYSANIDAFGVSFPADTDITDVPTIGDVINNFSIINGDEELSSKSSDKGLMAFGNDTISSNKANIDSKAGASNNSVLTDVATSTKPSNSSNSGNIVNSERPNVEIPVNNPSTNETVAGNNGSSNPTITLPDTSNQGSNSNQDEPDKSELDPEYVAGLETGGDKDKDKDKDDNKEENVNSNSNDSKENESTNNDNSNTPNEGETSENGNSNNSSSDNSGNVDMSATCEKDGYYYETESVLTFEKDENGKVVEVYKDMPIKKYCGPSQGDSTNTESPSTEEPAQTPSESESQTSTETNNSVESENPETSEQTETQPSTDAPSENTSEEVPADESLTFG